MGFDGGQRRAQLMGRIVAPAPLSFQRAMHALQQMVDMDVAVYYNGLARKNIYIRKAFLTINGETIRNLVGGAENGK